MAENRHDLLAQVAVWYYEDRLDQAEIAKRIGKSRSMVSRMLNEVRELGLVEIRVKYPMRRATDLEQQLIERFGLRSAWVLDVGPSLQGELRMRMLGRLAAAALQRYLQDGVKVGVAWSRTLHHVVMEMPQQALRDSLVVQISGSASAQNPVFDGPELVRQLAQKLGADYRYFPAPLVVREARLRRSLMQEASIAEALRQAASVDVAILGIGNVQSSASSLRDSGMLDREAIRELAQFDVAGDIIARQLDSDGNLLPVGFNERVVGIEPELLRQVPAVIGVSQGIDKARAVLAAIRGGWISVLVSDADTVRGTLKLDMNRAEQEAAR